MINNQTNKFEYIKQLENENVILKEENRKLKNKLLFGSENKNISLMQKDLLILALKKELAKQRQQNALLVLMR